jgi:hypothetical protein
MWGSGKSHHLANPDMPWNEEIRATWARAERLAASPRPLVLMLPILSELDVRAVLRRGAGARHRGARRAPNEVLVSSTLRDLVIGSGLEFEDRGAHELKGVPGEWHLFAVASI